MKMMSDYQRKCALQALDGLFEYSIANMFAEPVDPPRDNCPNYFEIIDHPMDLGTIKHKLLENKYQSTQDFKNDVALVWDNSYKFNGKQSVISSLAKQLQQIFNKSTENLTGNDAIDWQTKYEKIKDSIGIKALSAAAIKASTNSSASERKSNPVRAKHKPTPPPRAAAPPPPAPAPKPKNKKAQKVIPHEIKEDVIVPIIGENTTHVRAPLTKEEQINLSKDIELITNEDYINQLLDLIRERQPSLVQNDTSVEADVSDLDVDTAYEIRRMVDEFLKYQ